MSTGTAHSTATPQDPCAAETWTVSGTVVRLPKPGTPCGNYLDLELDDGSVTYSLPSTAKLGHTVLERELDRLCVQVGDHVSIAYLGWRETKDGERRYRAYRMEVDES